jgi:hypothetical protein
MDEINLNLYPAGFSWFQFLCGILGSLLDRRPCERFVVFDVGSQGNQFQFSTAAKKAGKPLVLEEFGVTGEGASSFTCVPDRR